MISGEGGNDGFCPDGRSGGMFQAMVRDFATKELQPLAAQVDEEEKFPAETVRKMAELGLMGVGIPEEYGGSGGDAIHVVIATEEVARGCGGTSAIYLASVSLSCYPIFNFGNEEQKRFVVPLAKATGCCFRLTGPSGGCLADTAAKRGDGI